VERRAAKEEEMKKTTKAKLEQALAILESGIKDWQNECQCVNPPGRDEEDIYTDEERELNDPDNPSHHAQYCPVYMSAVIEALRNGGEFPK
jgi:hypothetical protein